MFTYDQMIPNESKVVPPINASRMTLHETAVLNTSMLLTEIGDQMCWWQVKDVGDKSHYHYPEFDTNIKSQSPTSHSGVLEMLEID